MRGGREGEREGGTEGGREGGREGDEGYKHVVHVVYYIQTL